MEKVIISVPEAEDHRFKNWAKVIKSVDTGKTDGFAFEGPWLTIGRKAELDNGTIFLVYGRTGSRKNNTPDVTVYQVDESDPDGDETYYTELFCTNSEDWALDLRDKVAALINSPVENTRLDVFTDNELIIELKQRGYTVQ